MGCEPYSIAIIIDDINPKVKVDILATDIDKNIDYSYYLADEDVNELKNIFREMEMLSNNGNLRA